MQCALQTCPPDARLLTHVGQKVLCRMPCERFAVATRNSEGGNLLQTWHCGLRGQLKDQPHERHCELEGHAYNHHLTIGGTRSNEIAVLRETDHAYRVADEERQRSETNAQWRRETRRTRVLRKWRHMSSPESPTSSRGYRCSRRRNICGLARDRKSECGCCKVQKIGKRTFREDRGREPSLA